MSAPKPPSPPKQKKINQYEGYESNPLYQEWLDDPGEL